MRLHLGRNEPGTREQPGTSVTTAAPNVRVGADGARAIFRALYGTSAPRLNAHVRLQVNIARYTRERELK